MASELKKVKCFKLFIDDKASGFLEHSTPTIEHGYLCCFADEGLTQPQGFKDCDIQHWHAVPIYAD